MRLNNYLNAHNHQICYFNAHGIMFIYNKHNNHNHL